MMMPLFFFILMFPAALKAGLLPTPGVDMVACREHLARLAKAGTIRLSGKPKTFFESHFLPTVGQRGLTYKLATRGNVLEWEGYPGGKTYRVEFSKEVSEPTLEDAPHVRTLFLPEHESFKALTAGKIKKWLLGHPLHPFMVDPQARFQREALKEPSLLHRQVQLDAGLVGKTYLERFEKTKNSEFQRFLYVAPTGTGKSEIYLDLLNKRLEQVGKAPSLLIVSSERANVVRDRYSEAKALQDKLKDEGRDFEIIHWGGQGEAHGGVHDLEGLLKKVNTSQKPVVLVTTTASLRGALGAQGQDANFETNPAIQSNLNLLKAPTRGIFVDEAHHLGGDIISGVVERLLENNPRVTLSGFTATPISSNRSIQKLFNNHGFWAYEDDAQSYLNDPKPLDRKVSDIAKQLRMAFQEGELVGFDAIHYLPLKEESAEDVFIKREPENKYSINVINPELYPKLLAKLESILRTGRGIIVANDITEARNLTEAINQVLKQQSIHAELITSGNAPAGSRVEADILKRFKEGKTQVLVSVMKLDEGINIHDANYYIDLNPDPPARQFLQRVGRTTRVSPGKTETHVYLMSEFTEADLRSKLDASFGGTGRSKGGRGGGPKETETVDIDVDRFLRELERNNVERLNFWSTHRYSLPEDSLKAFQQEVAKNAANLFPGWVTKTNDYFESLAQTIPVEKRAAYLEELEALGLGQSVFSDGRRNLGTADSLHQAFALYAKHKGEVFDGQVTLEDLKKWGLTSGQKYSVDEDSLKAFQREVVKNSAEIFPNWTEKTKDYFESLAQILPVEKRAAYLEELEALGLGQAAFSIGRKAIGTADSIHRAFSVYAKHKGEVLDGRVTLEHLKKWGLTSGQKYSVDEDSLKDFQQEVVMNAVELFPGWVNKASDYFLSLAQNLPAEKQTIYLEELKALGLSQQAFRSGRTVIGSADSVHRAFALYAKHKGEVLDGRVTPKHLKKWGLTSGQKYSVDEYSLKDFQQEVVMQGAKLFPGWTAKTNDYFKSLAQKLPSEKRAKYLNELEDLRVSQTALSAGRSPTALGTTDSVHRAFVLYAKHKGEAIDGRVTLEDLKKWGLIIGQKYSVDDKSLKDFQQEVLMQSAELFPGWTGKTNDYFQSLAQTLPTEKQAEYLKELESLGISQRAFNSGRKQTGSADSVHRAFVLYAKYAGHQVQSRITLQELKNMGLIQ